jgi:hypothetical protein
VDASFVTRWDGPGLTSTSARTANVGAGFDLTALGVIRNSDLDITTGVPGSTYTTFSGQPVTLHDVLVKYTYTGDGNLDGAVTFDDYAAMDSAFFGLIPNLGWATGDINFDGVINFDDYSVVDQAFFFQGAPLAGERGVAVVPEPGMWLLAAVTLAVVSFTMRRSVKNGSLLSACAARYALSRFDKSYRSATVSIADHTAPGSLARLGRKNVL